MKRFAKIILLLVGIIAAVLAALLLLLVWAGRQPAVREGYSAALSTDQPLEQKYAGMGTFAVSTWQQSAEDEKIGTFRIWYPTELENSARAYPAVVMANGTGVPASKYEAIFQHLASWGFLVIGNEDGSSWDGASSAASLELLLQLNCDPDSLFCGRIDTAHIGIAGHSQGGVGAINAVTAQENGTLYRAIYIASATQLALAEALGWPYDISKLSIPCFMTAGTLQADAGNGEDAGIAPLSSLQENYHAIPAETEKICARRTGADHGDMLALADSYMTAWFLYHLQDDQQAGSVFLGGQAEILTNVNWQDVEKNH